MAESTFPGNNPFSTNTSANPASAGGSSSMQRLEEEEEMDTFASPTASNFPSGVMMNRDASPFNASPFGAAQDSSFASSGGGGGAFGSFNFNPAGSSSSGGGSRSNQPSSATAGSMEAPQSFPNNYNLNRRTSVSAESLAPSGQDDSSWKAPSFPKTAEQNQRLRTAVSRNFLFAHLDDDQTDQVLGALQERKIPAKDVKVIIQGDVGDYFYVVEDGAFDVHVSSTGKLESGPGGLGAKVTSCGPGTSFGELALMYNAPRAATVVSSEPSILWQLDRVTFRRILMDSAFQRRRMYESFLDSVPLLKDLTPYERSKVADALETSKYQPGTAIIREGDIGDHFYILEDGTAAVYKEGVESSVKTYTKGDYFGELALLNDKPRAASVIAETEVKVAMLGKNGFQRLLGPVESIMRRDDPSRDGGEVDPLSSA